MYTRNDTFLSMFKISVPKSLPSLLIIILIISGLIILISPTNTPEKNTAFWNDGTEDFFNQIINTNGNYQNNSGNAVFDNKSVSQISKKETEELLTKANNSAKILGLSTSSDGAEKWVEVDLSDFKLYAWEGNTKVFEFPTSTGRRYYETPTGEFVVWRKVRSQAYKGGSKEKGDYYYLPNVPYSLFFYNDKVKKYKGYALHGAYWHTDFGIKNKSSGCVNLKPEDAAKLYVWAGPTTPDGVGAINSTEENPGIRVVIHQ